MAARICTFFGHADARDGLEHLVEKQVVMLIEERGVTHFYVGINGRFDSLVRRVLTNLQEKYPQIHCYCVLHYIPTELRRAVDFSLQTIVPEGIERAPKRAAIVWRNQWMLRKAQYVITHVVHYGGAAKCKEKAEKTEKTL